MLDGVRRKAQSLRIHIFNNIIYMHSFSSPPPSLTLDILLLLIQVTRHLSPFEQQIVMPWIKTFPKRAYAKFSGSGPYLVATAVIVYGTAVASDAADAAQDKSYRY